MKSSLRPRHHAKAAKEENNMATNPDNPNAKPVFTKLTPNMTREQKVKNLISALENSGFTVHPSEKQKGDGGLS